MQGIDVDRISALSDDLLGLILSPLTLKEATATSILGRRWKYLWTLTPKLDFDGSELLLLHDYDRAKCVRWIDRVVAARASSPTPLEEFRVYLDLTRDCSRAIDDWLRFAVSRKVERLELNLTDRGEMNITDGECRSYDEFYTFPYHNKGIFPNDLTFLKKLSAHSVNVSGEALNFFLGNCPLLEQLSVSGSNHLETLHVSRTSASFKCLEISCCFNLTSVVARDSNVVSFKYGGRRMPDLELINVPLLTEVWLRVELTFSTKLVFKMFMCVFPQLEIFKIYFPFHGISWEETRKFFYKARNRKCNLKQLVVNTGSRYNGYDSLLPLINMIHALPNLERFVLEAPRMDSIDNRYVLNQGSCSAESNTLLRLYPQQLKEVEFVGYHGVECQVELIRHLVENLVALENIVIDTRRFNADQFDRPWVRIPQPQSEADMLARAYNAKEQLQMYVPSRINLKIL